MQNRIMHSKHESNSSKAFYSSQLTQSVSGIRMVLNSYNIFY